MRNFVICPGSSVKNVQKEIINVTNNTQKENKTQSPNPTMSKAQQSTQESRDNGGAGSTLGVTTVQRRRGGDHGERNMIASENHFHN